MKIYWYCDKCQELKPYTKFKQEGLCKKCFDQEKKKRYN